MSDLESCYDVIILGAGIAGLRVGIEVLKKYGKGNEKQKLRVCILEKYDYVGGRVVTFRKDIDEIGEVQWESGAGRISKSHKKVLGLLRQYGLHFVDISHEVDFISTYDYSLRKDMFSELLDVYLKPFDSVPQKVLENDTLGNLLEKVLGKAKARSFYTEFPYYSEIHTLRADLALQSFKEEMGTNSGFVTCIEGLSSLMNAMNKEFQELGGTLIKNMEVVSVENYKDGMTRIDCKIVEKECKTILKNKRRFLAKVCVAALHSEAVSSIRGLKESPVLQKLKMEPLLRVYAIFPMTAKEGRAWFDGIHKVVTDSPIRYIIPINPKKGIIMISYTDGADARRLMAEKDLQGWIMKEIRHLFPDSDIPDPLFFKKHPWTSGCTYWLPGKYNVYDESMTSIHPLPKKLPGVYMCGESFAIKQCWMESALDQADLLLGSKEFIKAIKECK
jgi:Flavin containing amine oxidoreductase